MVAHARKPDWDQLYDTVDSKKGHLRARRIARVRRGIRLVTNQQST